MLSLVFVIQLYMVFFEWKRICLVFYCLFILYMFCHWRTNYKKEGNEPMNHFDKKCSVRLFLQLSVGGLMSYLRCLCLFVYSGVQHILCCVFLRLVLPVSLDCPFLIAPSVYFWEDLFINQDSPPPPLTTCYFNQCDCQS